MQILSRKVSCCPLCPASTLICSPQMHTQLIYLDASKTRPEIQFVNALIDKKVCSAHTVPTARMVAAYLYSQGTPLTAGQFDHRDHLGKDRDATHAQADSTATWLIRQSDQSANQPITSVYHQHTALNRCANENGHVFHIELDLPARFVKLLTSHIHTSTMSPSTLSKSVRSMRDLGRNWRVASQHFGY